MTNEELSAFLTRIGRIYINAALKKTCPQTEMLVMFDDLKFAVVPFESTEKVRIRNKLAKIQTANVYYSPEECIYFLNGKTTIQILRRVSVILQRNGLPRLRNAILFGAVIGTKIIDGKDVAKVEEQPLLHALEDRI